MPVSYEVGEDDQMVNFVIMKMGMAGRPITVLFSTQDGSATGTINIIYSYVQ